MIKNFDTFINESLNTYDEDFVNNLILGCEYNIKTYIDDKQIYSYYTERTDEGIMKLFVSAEPDVALDMCDADITFMLLPPNFKPNVLVSTEPGSCASDTDIEKFIAIYKEKISVKAAELFKLFTENNNKINQILLTLAYNRKK